MMKHLARLGVLGVLSLSGATSWGRMIGNVAADKIPPQSCKLTLDLAPVLDARGKKVRRQGTCSATIIGESTLLSAAHCFSGREFTRAVLHCPGEAERSISSWTIPEQYRRPENELVSRDMTKLDLAIVRIEGKLATPPAKLPRTAQDLTNLFKATQAGSPPHCVSCGYGSDEKGKKGSHACRSVAFEKWICGDSYSYSQDTKSGKVEVKGAKVDYWDEDERTLLFSSDHVRKDSKVVSGVTDGDSGGSLLCDGEKNIPVLFGVISGIGEMKTAQLEDKNVALAASLAHQSDLIDDLSAQNRENTLTKSCVARPEALTPHKRKKPSNSHQGL